MWLSTGVAVKEENMDMPSSQLPSEKMDGCSAHGTESNEPILECMEQAVANNVILMRDLEHQETAQNVNLTSGVSIINSTWITPKPTLETDKRCK